MKRLFFLLPLAVFLGMAVYFGIGLTKDPRIIPSALIDQPVPDFELPPLKPQKPGLATADLLERPHVEERYKKALARLAKVVDLTV